MTIDQSLYDDAMSWLGASVRVNRSTRSHANFMSNGLLAPMFSGGHQDLSGASPRR
ncbi:hypothetical protein JQ604_24130 [Bradyrhizobium jicamae]|uniref:hypothetical protein n=1 Tax=Bradyrhizobium jicamae TaxID=280332 RepID=UPI001BA753BE|nr:hypothetical protein [Bradyrhizobium jicamae]MBR0755284.1 hypothetical protein [Bradyrhizobium jicamae]